MPENKPETLQSAAENTPEAAAQPTDKKAKSVKREIIEWVLTLVIPVVVVLILHNFIFTFAIVQETSMLDTLQPNQWMAVSRIHYRFTEPERGDIITCHYQGQGKKIFVKRVIAVEGDTLRIDNGQVFVNGEALREPYVLYPSQETLPELTLAADELFVMGDNRAVSWDSRIEGPLKKDAIYGFVMGAVFPFNDIKGFYESPYGEG